MRRLTGISCAVLLASAILIASNGISSYSQTYYFRIPFDKHFEVELSHGQVVISHFAATGDDDDASAATPAPAEWDRHAPGFSYGQGDKGHGVAFSYVAIRHWLILVAALALFAISFRRHRLEISRSRQDDDRPHKDG